MQSGKKSEEKRTLEVTKEKSIKVTVKVLVPVREHPKVSAVLSFINRTLNQIFFFFFGKTFPRCHRSFSAFTEAASVPTP